MSDCTEDCPVTNCSGAMYAITVWASAPERMGLDPVHLYVDLFDEALAQAGEDSFVPIMRCLQFETRCRGEQNGFGQA